MATQPVLIAGRWRDSASTRAFQATNPQTCQPTADSYPVSDWDDIEEALAAAADCFDQMRRTVPAEQRAQFLEAYAQQIETSAEVIVALAHEETALPVKPRLATIELPRTTDQLRQAAVAARQRDWATPTIDTGAGIRSILAPVGPVCVFGPNNFPLAFNSVAGGDFAAAIAAGNPVIAKANSSHPGTTRLLAEAACAAAQATGMPVGCVQLLYRLDHADGERLVADPRVGATGYTGSRSAGLALKRAADAVGRPIYLELSSINPVILLPGALRERGPQIARELCGSCLMGTGQFCTNPGLTLLLAGEEAERFVQALAEEFSSAPVGTLLGAQVEKNLVVSVEALIAAGAELVVGGQKGVGTGFSVGNTLLRVNGKRFLQNPETLQREAFGNESLLVIAEGPSELVAILAELEGNLTGCIYSHQAGDDDELYALLEPHLRQRVGRLLNDKMPTGVAVSPAMNHGGPYPATGHPGFTAVGIPASLRRFAALHCYDAVREHRLPAELRQRQCPGRVPGGLSMAAGREKTSRELRVRRCCGQFVSNLCARRKQFSLARTEEHGRQNGGSKLGHLRRKNPCSAECQTG